MKARTKRFGIDVLTVCATLSRSDAHQVAGHPLMRAATSVGADHRAACRGRSRNGFIAKLGVVEEEADESTYWPELLVEYHGGRGVDLEQAAALHREADDILAIVVSAIRTARRDR